MRHPFITGYTIGFLIVLIIAWLGGVDFTNRSPLLAAVFVEAILAGFVGILGSLLMRDLL